MIRFCACLFMQLRLCRAVGEREPNTGMFGGRSETRALCLDAVSAVTPGAREAAISGGILIQRGSGWSLSLCHCPGSLSCSREGGGRESESGSLPHRACVAD